VRPLRRRRGAGAIDALKSVIGTADDATRSQVTSDSNGRKMCLFVSLKPCDTLTIYEGTAVGDCHVLLPQCCENRRRACLWPWSPHYGLYGALCGKGPWGGGEVGS